jgi:hypothetical protein
MDPKVEAALAVAEQDAETDLIGAAARILAAEVRRLVKANEELRDTERVMSWPGD